MKIRLSLVLVVVLVLLIGSVSSAVGAQTDDGLGGDENGSGGGDADVESNAELVVPVPPLAGGDPAADHPSGVSSEQPGPPETAADLLNPSAPCARWSPGEYDPETEISRPPVCLATWVCGGERVDDIVSGRISGAQTTGAYRQYLNQMVGWILPDVGGEAPDITDAESVNDLLIDQGLSDRPSDRALPIFYWCRHSDQTDIEVLPTPGPNGENFGPTFAWDTTFEAEYPIDQVRDDLLDRLKARLALYRPEPAAIPPLDSGNTYVRFPSWFWIENPLENEHIYAESDLETIRIEIRATLERVEWHFGDSFTLTCQADGMVAYDESVHDPIADAPDCSHAFGQLADFEVSTTITYRIEEKISYRLTRNRPFAPQPWLPHPTSPEVELTTDIGPYDVHQLLSLNVNEEQTP